MSGSDPRKVSALSQLPQAIEPERDLWPAIQARLKEHAPGAAGPAVRPGRGARLRWLAAAAMVASVAVGVWIGRDLAPVPGAASPGLAQQPPLRESEAAAVNAAYISDPRYRHEREVLMQSVQARLAAMPEPARAKVAASLKAIEDAKKDLESALGKDPSNALLQELLIDTYQDEMRVLTDVHESADPSRGI